MIYYTGARISEVSKLTVSQVDFVDKTVIIRSLKKRRKGVYRQIPLPDCYLIILKAFVDDRAKLDFINSQKLSLWSFSTRTASRYIKEVMNNANIDEPRASALGLRHGFAVHAATRVPLTQVQIWMGHGSLSTTSIYLQVSGVEERNWAEKLWQDGEF